LQRYRLEARASLILLFIIVNLEVGASIIIIDLRLEPHSYYYSLLLTWMLSAQASITEK